MLRSDKQHVATENNQSYFSFRFLPLGLEWNIVSTIILFNFLFLYDVPRRMTLNRQYLGHSIFFHN